jgi:hypothetical protein
MPYQDLLLHEIPDRFYRAWRLYERWGKLFAEPTEAEPPDSAYQAIQRFTAAFHSLAEHEKGRVASLLDKSDCRLAPLSDPLRLGFRGHRWLDIRREREESYSDWLAWLLKQMDSTEVLQVFGLDNTEFGALVRGTKADFSREERLSEPDSERKRMDIVIRFGDAGILLIEVKIRELEEVGGAENLPVYLEWLKKQQPEDKRRYAILLVPSPIESPRDGWEVRSWDSVSLTLRRQAAQNVPNQVDHAGKQRVGQKKRELLLAAMMLCFAGAVEQNILGLDGTGAAVSAPQTAFYLEQFLKKANHGTATIPS